MTQKGEHQTLAAPRLPQRRSPAVWVVLLLLTLLIFGAVVSLITLDLRSEIRERIVNRDAEIFTAVAQMLLEEAAGDAHPDPADLFTTALQTSKLSGVLAVRLYTPEGVFTDAVPYDTKDRPLTEEQLHSLRNFSTVSVFDPEGDLASIFEFYVSPETSEPVPLLHVAIPLFNPLNGDVAGIAYFTIDGEPVAAQFAELDQSLTLQSGVLFSLGSLLFLLVAGLSFYALNRADRLLRERSEKLIQANQELTLAAKSSALGAVTAHLIHGLKSPLAGLNQFVHSAGSGDDAADDEDWQAAGETTRRMQAMIDEIVDILRQEDAPATYEVSLSELADLVSAKIRPRADKAGVDCEVVLNGKNNLVLAGRNANLAILILANLLENALQASDRGGLIRLGIDTVGGEIRFRVSDRGAGLPAHVRENLFSPSKQRGDSGSGLGLAISHQLAQHLGARLELVESGPSGTVFQLTLTHVDNQG